MQLGFKAFVQVSSLQNKMIKGKTSKQTSEKKSLWARDVEKARDKM